MELNERKRIVETDERHLEEFLIDKDDPGRKNMIERIRILKKEIRQEKKLQKPMRIHVHETTPKPPNTDSTLEIKETRLLGKVFIV